MAPIKRGSTATKAAPAKKAKTAVLEAPLLDFLGKCDEIPKQCRELLQGAVPICLEVVEAKRHKYQAEVLEQLASLLASAEGKKRQAVAAAEAELTDLEAEKGTAATEASAKKGTSAAKEAECEQKGKVVDAAREVSNTAKANLSAAQAAEVVFNKKQAGLLAEQESFAKLMAEVFVPLKEDTLKGQKRNKQVLELQKKLKTLGAQDSLGDSLVKLKPNERHGTFAKATMQFAEDYFNKHTAKVAADIAALSSEESSHKTTIANTQAIFDDKNAALQVVEKEWDAMQDIWVALEAETAQATRSMKQIEARMPRVNKSIDKAKGDLDKFLELTALFAQLKEHSTTAPPEEEPEEEKQDAEEANEGEGEEPHVDMQA